MLPAGGERPGQPGKSTEPPPDDFVRRIDKTKSAVLRSGKNPVGHIGLHRRPFQCRPMLLPTTVRCSSGRPAPWTSFDENPAGRPATQRLQSIGALPAKDPKKAPPPCSETRKERLPHAVGGRPHRIAFGTASGTRERSALMRMAPSVLADPCSPNRKRVLRQTGRNLGGDVARAPANRLDSNWQTGNREIEKRHTETPELVSRFPISTVPDLSASTRWRSRPHNKRCFQQSDVGRGSFAELRVRLAEYPRHPTVVT